MLTRIPLPRTCKGAAYMRLVIVGLLIANTLLAAAVWLRLDAVQGLNETQYLRCLNSRK